MWEAGYHRKAFIAKRVPGVSGHTFHRPQFDLFYSYRRASMGSSCAAFQAG